MSLSLLLAALLSIGPVRAQPAPAASIAQLEAALKKKPDALNTREQLAAAYMRAGKPERVIELLNPYTDLLNSGGFLTLGSSYSAKKDYANEVRVLGMLADKEKDNYQWHVLLGQAYLKLSADLPEGDKKTASLTSGVQSLRRALQLSPKYKPAYDLLLTTFLQQKDHTEARELLNEGLEKFGRRPELQRELCRLDAQDGFVVQAVSNCRQSIRLSPTYPDHYVFLVQALYDQKEEQLAEAQIVSAARRFPKSEFVQWAAGKLFMEKKNYSVASRYFRTAVDAAPGTGRSEFGLARALYESGQEAEALAHFIKACKADATTLEAFWAATGRLKQSGNAALGAKYSAGANTCR